MRIGFETTGDACGEEASGLQERRGPPAEHGPPGSALIGPR